MIKWQEGRAVGIQFTEHLPEQKDDVRIESIEVKLESRAEPVLGRIDRLNSSYMFYPIIPFQQGFTYVLFYDNVEVHRFEIPSDDMNVPARVTGIYPSCDTVPENLLKVYLRFATSMGHLPVYDYIIVKDEAGKTVNNIFLRLQPELWNRERNLLTLWLDPGRIKRDLIPNRLLGQPLHAGRKYTLFISKDIKDAEGNELGDMLEKSFFTIQADRVKPSVLDWTISTPHAGTREPLILSFPEPLDYGLLLETISVYDYLEELSGEIILADAQREWRFVPEKAWNSGEYRLRALSVLEDLAGNNLNRPFEIELAEKINYDNKEAYELVFEVH